MATLDWDVHQVAEALHLTEAETLEYFKDGRRISFLIERRIAREVLGGHVAESEGAAFDVYDREGRMWEIRSITRGGIYFCPSYMVGSGRHFEESGFLEKLDIIEGYIVADIDEFPS